MLPDVGSTIVPPGLQEAVALGGVDHGDGRTVLHAAAGVEHLELGEEVALQVAPDAPEPHERRVADQVEQRVGHFHAASDPTSRGSCHRHSVVELAVADVQRPAQRRGTPTRA